MLAAVITVSLLAAGCGPAAVQTGMVSGTVTLDGNPMPEGDVFFKGPDSKMGTFSVVNGQFSGECQPGSYRVEIMAYRNEAPPADPTGYVPPTESVSKVNFLPAAFNTDSTMTAEVKAGENNEFKFEVKSM
jgi:hypothetical protein